MYISDLTTYQVLLWVYYDLLWSNLSHDNSYTHRLHHSVESFFEINFQMGWNIFRFELNFQMSELDLELQINSNRFSSDRSFQL